MLSDASLYHNSRTMQINDNTKLFLDSVIPNMDWSREDQDIVMDIGCGTGSSTKTLLLPNFPRIKKIVAVDVLPEMIDFARLNNASEKIEYHVADIEKWDTISKWKGHISKVFSVYCFNWLENQPQAFRNLYNILKPGGEAALLFSLSLAFWNSYPALVESPKWNKYLKNANGCVPESHFKKQRAPYYKNMLETIGYKVHLCEDEERAHSYQDDEVCKDGIFSRCGLSSYIPENLKHEFKEDLFKGFMEHGGRDKDGKPIGYHTAINLLIQKPNA